MGLSMLQRKPDSGLGNIRSSPADPSRNIDWVLMLAQAVLTVAGCFIVFSATRVRTADPYTFVTRQVIFAIAATVVMFVVMAIDYEWLKQHARTLYVITIVVLARRIADQARTAVGGVDVVRQQTDGLPGVNRINDSGVRILRSARAVRKVAVGK